MQEEEKAGSEWMQDMLRITSGAFRFVARWGLHLAQLPQVDESTLLTSALGELHTEILQVPWEVVSVLDCVWMPSRADATSAGIPCVAQHSLRLR